MEDPQKIGPGPAEHAQRVLTKNVIAKEIKMLKEKETEPQGRAMKCKLCTGRGQTWSGSPPVCAFESGQFSSKNWNCATCITIRERMESCDAVQWVSGDQRYGTLPVGDEFNDYFDNFVVCVWATWYKSRGKTDALFFLTDSSNVIIPTENDCLHFLAAGKNDEEQI